MPAEKENTEILQRLERAERDIHTLASLLVKHAGLPPMLAEILGRDDAAETRPAAMAPERRAA
jgi:hypothetical protein